MGDIRRGIVAVPQEQVLVRLAQPSPFGLEDFEREVGLGVPAHQVADGGGVERGQAFL